MANQDGHGGEMRHRTDLGTRVKTERAKCVDADKGEERLKRASGSTYQKKKNVTIEIRAVDCNNRQLEKKHLHRPGAQKM